MFKERYRHLFSIIHPKQESVNAILGAVTQSHSNRHWLLAAACLIMLLITSFVYAPPPLDAVSASRESSNAFLPTEKVQWYGCCDVRAMELNILDSSIHEDILFLEIQLVSEQLHPDMVFTLRIRDGSIQEAYHLLCTQLKKNHQGKKFMTHLMSCKLDPAAIPPEGKQMTFAINNYTCGLDHSLFPHWEKDAAWNDVLPDCHTVDFTLFPDGSIRLIK